MSTCKDCKFQVEWRCRRFPPQQALFMVDNQRPIYDSFPSFPPVQPDEWCGEHQDIKTEIELTPEPLRFFKETPIVEFEMSLVDWEKVDQIIDSTGGLGNHSPIEVMGVGLIVVIGVMETEALRVRVKGLLKNKI